MIEFNCPSCNKTIKAPESKGGSQGRCPACKASIDIPDPDAVAVGSSPPLRFEWLDQAPDAPYDPAVNGHAPKEQQAPRADEWFVKTVHFIDLIVDLRFKRYLTPYIIRIIWGLLLVFAIGCLFLQRIALPIIDEFSEQTAKTETRGGGFMPQSPGAQRPDSHRQQDPNDLAKWIGKTVVYIAVTLFLLMLARVWAEMVIVIFNISNDLKETKLSLTQRQ